MNGYFASRFGYRSVMIVALGFLTAFIFITFFANSAAVLLVGQILCGFSGESLPLLGMRMPPRSVRPTFADI